MLKHPIISTVIGGLILSFLSWFFGLLPAIWAGIVSAGRALLGIITAEVQSPVWLIILILLLVFYSRGIWSLSLSLFSQKKPSESTSAEPEFYEEDEPVAELQLSRDETALLNFLVQRDGRPAESSDLKHYLSFTNLQSQQIVEVLFELELVDVRKDIINGPQIHLTRKGRDYVLGNKYART